MHCVPRLSRVGLFALAACSSAQFEGNTLVAGSRQGPGSSSANVASAPNPQSSRPAIECPKTLIAPGYFAPPSGLMYRLLETPMTACDGLQKCRDLNSQARFPFDYEVAPDAITQCIGQFEPLWQLSGGQSNSFVDHACAVIAVPKPKTDAEGADYPATNANGTDNLAKGIKTKPPSKEAPAPLGLYQFPASQIGDFRTDKRSILCIYPTST